MKIPAELGRIEQIIWLWRLAICGGLADDGPSGPWPEETEMTKKPVFRLLALGFVIWLVPFLAAFAIFDLREANRPLFESIMPVVLTATVVLASVLYLRGKEGVSVKYGLVAGLVWMAMSLGLDFPMFFGGPIDITPAQYIADIGLTYLIILIVPLGMATLAADGE